MAREDDSLDDRRQKTGIKMRISHLLGLFLLLSIMTGIAGASYPNVSISIYNNQSATSSVNHAQRLIIDMTTPLWSNVSSDAGNIRFYHGATELHSECMSGCNNTGTDAVFYVNMSTDTIGASGTKVINATFLSTSTEYDGIFAGEMSYLTTPYGTYNNCGLVFGYCDNFPGTSLNATWYNSGITAVVNDGLTLTNGYPGVLSNPIQVGYSGSTSVVEARINGDTGSGHLYWMGQFNGYGLSAGCSASHAYQVITISGGSGLGCSSVQGSVIDGVPYVWTFVNTGSNQFMYVNYAQIATTSAPDLSPSNLTLGAVGTPNILIMSYIVARPLSPGGIMPLPTYSSPTPPTTTSTTSTSTTSTSTTTSTTSISTTTSIATTTTTTIPTTTSTSTTSTSTTSTSTTTINYTIAGAILLLFTIPGASLGLLILAFGLALITTRNASFALLMAVLTSFVLFAFNSPGHVVMDLVVMGILAVVYGAVFVYEMRMRRHRN